MYYKCNSKRNAMLALIHFSDTFCLVIPKHFFIPLISPPGYKPLRLYLSPPKTPYEVIRV